MRKKMFDKMRAWTAISGACQPTTTPTMIEIMIHWVKLIRRIQLNIILIAGNVSLGIYWLHRLGALSKTISCPDTLGQQKPSEKSAKLDWISLIYRLLSVLALA